MTTKPIVYHNEGSVKREVKKLLEKHGYFFWMPPANGFGRTGISDFQAIKAGVFLAIETKFGKNTTTPMQRGFLNSVLAEGGFSFVVCERRVDTLRTWLETFDRAAAASMRSEDITARDGATMLDCVQIMTEELATST